MQTGKDRVNCEHSKYGVGDILEGEHLEHSVCSVE